MKNFRAFLPVCAAAMTLLAIAPALVAQNRIFFQEQTVKVGQTGVLVPVRIDTSQERHGVSLSIKYDQTKLTVMGVDKVNTVTADAEFFAGQIASSTGGLLWGVVMDLGQDQALTKSIPVGNNQVVVNIRMDVAATVAGETQVTPQDGLGQPVGAWQNLFSTRGVNTLPTLVGARVIIEPTVVGTQFRRGNVNGDALLDISDAIGILGFLFLGQADKVVCVDAADIKDKGSIDISDAISVLNFLFQGGAPPAAPGPEVCGPDATLETPDLGCVQGC